MNYEGVKDETNPLKTLISSFRFHPSVFRPWPEWRHWSRGISIISGRLTTAASLKRSMLVSLFNETSVPELAQKARVDQILRFQLAYFRVLGAEIFQDGFDPGYGRHGIAQ
jgi:hypothetical protein